MAGRQRNRLTEKRGLRCPGTFESSNPRIRAQYAGGHSCFLSGSGLDAGLLVSCPRIAAAGKTNYAQRGGNCVRKKNREDPKTFPKGRHGRSGYEARCTCGCCLLPFVVRGVLIRDIVNRRALLLPPFQFAFPLVSNQSYRIGRLYRIISPGIPLTPLADTLV